MQQISSMRKLLYRFFPCKSTTGFISTDSDQWDHLSGEERQVLSDVFISQGEIALLNDDLSAIDYFENAAALTPDYYGVWYREGQAFADYGMRENKEKALIVASRYFKLAAQLAPERFEVWFCWGSVLLQLGMTFNEHHFYLEAKEKLQTAINCNPKVPPDLLAHLYWDYGLIWAELAQHSGEPVDVHLSIQAFQMALSYHAPPPPEFLNDCGNAYLQMGLLINDSRLYLQAVTHLKNAVAIAPGYLEGCMSLANAYSQLYINTLDEQYVTLAGNCYAYLCQQSPDRFECWLGWAQILGESGKQNRDAKKLTLSIEKCVQCREADSNQPALYSQWVESLSELGKITGRVYLFTEAEALIARSTEQYPDDPDLWYAYGCYMMALGHYYHDSDYFERAIEKLQFGLSLDRTNAEIWHALALAHAEIAHIAVDRDFIDRSLRFFNRAMDLKSACPSLIFDAANTYLLSFNLNDQYKDLERAVYLYESLLQNQKEALIHHPEWVFKYASSLEWLGHHSDEDECFIRALDLYFHVLLLDPETPKIHLHIALCLRHLGDSSNEMEYLRRSLCHFRFAMQQDEEDEEVWLEWGLALIILAQNCIEPDSAAQYYAEAEQKIIRSGQLGNLNVFYHFACLYSLMNRFNEAVAFLHKAQKVDALPSLEEMADDEWLDGLRKTELFAQFLASLEGRRDLMP
jgi:tetratricopeptide (TPR) repeat protein